MQNGGRPHEPYAELVRNRISMDFFNQLTLRNDAP